MSPSSDAEAAGLPLVVDVHAHTVVPAVAALVAGEPGLAEELEQLARTFGVASVEQNERLASGPYIPLLSDPSVRFGSMDAAGIDIQAVSITPTQYHYWASEGLAAELVAAANEHIGDLVGRHPERLVGLATVALQYPELAADQLRHATQVLGLRGVEISTSAGGREFSDARYEPFWSAAAELGSFVFVHPWGCSLGERLSSFYLGNIVGQPVETTLALSHLIFGGVLDRHPNLHVCGAHGGGYLPYYIGRADHAYDVRPESRTSKQRPSAYLERMFFDSLVYRPDTLAQLIAVAGPGHVLLGTDYPFDMSVSDPLGRLRAVPNLSSESLALIAGANAARLLGMPSSDRNVT